MSPSTNPKDILGLQKPPLRLLPAAGSLYTAMVMGLGAQKYGPYNWREHPVRLTVYLEAAQRHLLAVQDGQDTDMESGMPHAAHVAACMFIVLDALATGNLIDDRNEPGAAAELIAVLTERMKAQAAESSFEGEIGRAIQAEYEQAKLAHSAANRNSGGCDADCGACLDAGTCCRTEASIELESPSCDELQAAN